MDQWLKEHGMPEITRVYKTTMDGMRLTLEDVCLKSGTLASIAYGFKRCSLKHKIGPQEKFCNNYPPCREVWRSGKKVVKFIGYDAGEHYRSDKVLLNDLADPKYSKWYPLMEWGWDREECIRQIEAAGLPQPGKSSCFFCPSMRAEEIIDLREHYPDLFRRALALEDNARANLKTVQGLGRNYSWKERFGKEQCAWDFVKLLTTDTDIQKLVYEDTSAASVLKSVNTSQDTMNLLNKDTPGDSIIDMSLLDTAIDAGVIPNRFEQYEEAYEKTDSLIKSYVDEEGDSSTFLFQMKNQIDKILKK